MRFSNGGPIWRARRIDPAFRRKGSQKQRDAGGRRSAQLLVQGTDSPYRRRRRRIQAASVGRRGDAVDSPCPNHPSAPEGRHMEGGYAAGSESQAQDGFDPRASELYGIICPSPAVAMRI